MRPVDVDANATRPARKDAIAAYLQAASLSSRQAQQDSIEQSRALLARAFGAHTDEVVFVRGGSHANALALWASVWTSPQSPPTIALSRAEHRATLDVAFALEKTKRAHIAWLDVDNEGRVPVDDALPLVAPPQLLSSTLAHNETGIVTSLTAWRAAARTHGAMLHLDAVQALGRIELPWACLEVTMMSLAGHKIGSLGGIGVLLVRRDSIAHTRLVRAPDGPFAYGFGYVEHQAGASAGLCASFAAAVDDLVAHREREAKLAPLRDRFEQELSARFRSLGQSVTIIGGAHARLPNTSLLRLHDIPAEAMLMALDVEGFSASQGSACSAGAPEPSAAIVAMGYDEKAMREILRVSLAWPQHGDAQPFENDLRRMLDVMVRVAAQGLAC